MSLLTRNKDTDLIILSNLDDKSLFNLSISNPKDKYLKKLCADESFWLNRLKNNFPEFKTTEKRNWKQTYLALVYYSKKYFRNGAIEELAKGGMKNINLIQFFIDKGENYWNGGMKGAARGGHRDLVQFFIKKGANNWNYGMEGAAEGGQRDLVEFFIEKGANSWNYGMYYAALGRHKDLIQFFIEKGANDWYFAMLGAKRVGHRDLVEFFIQKGANFWE